MKKRKTGPKPKARRSAPAIPDDAECGTAHIGDLPWKVYGEWVYCPCCDFATDDRGHALHFHDVREQHPQERAYYLAHHELPPPSDEVCFFNTCTGACSRVLCSA